MSSSLTFAEGRRNGVAGRFEGEAGASSAERKSRQAETAASSELSEATRVDDTTHVIAIRENEAPTSLVYTCTCLELLEFLSKHPNLKSSLDMLASLKIGNATQRMTVSS